MFNIGSAFHTACLLPHFPPLLSAPAFSTPAFSVAPCSVHECIDPWMDTRQRGAYVPSGAGTNFKVWGGQ